MAVTQDVLVVGAGPVGLTAACQLARLGVPVRVIDPLDRPATEARAVAVHARTQEMFAAMGVLEQLEARGRRLTSMEVIDGETGRTRMTLSFDGLATRHPQVLDIVQPDTEAVLAERAAELGVVVERGVQLTALVQDSSGLDVTARTADGERSWRTGWVVGADGGHSTVRRLVGDHLVGSFHGATLATGDVDLDTDLAPDVGRLFTHRDGVGMILTLPGRRARLLFAVKPPQDGLSCPTLEEFQALVDARTGRRIRLSNPGRLGYFEIHHGQVQRYRHGRVFLAGDAAHIHSPAGGQGMNTGVQDATNLAWKLALVATGRADDELLDSYHDERHPVGAAVVRSTSLLTTIDTAGGVEALPRNLMMFLMGHVHGIEHAVGTKFAELAVRYRDSDLSVQHGHHPRGAARAGDHAPDPDGLYRPDGTPVTVESLQQDPGFTLLTRSENPEVLDGLRNALAGLGTVVEVVRAAADGTGDRVVDPHDAVGGHYGFGPEGIALIRPDGYLGLVAHSAEPDLLGRYLADSVHVTDARRPSHHQDHQPWAPRRHGRRHGSSVPSDGTWRRSPTPRDHRP